MTRKIITLSLIILHSFVYVSDSQTISKQKHSLNTALNTLKYDKDLANAGVGFYVVDVNSGEVLSAHNPNLSLTPASTQKLITTATALETFGPSYTFKTQVLIVGEIDKQTGMLEGKVIVKGGGDPTLGSKYFPTTATHSFLAYWSKSISDLGIKYINGEIVADGRIYGNEIVPSTWSWEDIGNYFGAGANGLSIYDNMYTLYYNTSSKVGGKTKITKVDPLIPGMTFDNYVKADAINSDKSYIFGAPYTYSRFINGRLPLNKKDYKVKGSIPDPAWYAAYELKTKLKSYGVNSGKATTFRMDPGLESVDSMQQKILFTTRSPKLIDIIEKTNFRSINLFAEHLLKHSQLKSCNWNLEKIDKNFVENFWARRGVNVRGMAIYDGSGLSKYNTVTAKQIASVLKYMKTKSKFSTEYYESIPVVGEGGTVKRICLGTSAEGNMHAKSGSIKAVRAYAGYVTTKSGREVAFALIINNYNGSSTNTRKKMEKLMAAVADFAL